MLLRYPEPKPERDPHWLLCLVLLGMLWWIASRLGKLWWYTTTGAL